MNKSKTQNPKSHYDVVVIGGGIQGVGVAQAAAADGYSVLLLEKGDLACGTSSRSSKLIHGGLRYLETGQWRLVRESLGERDILAQIAPGLVRWVPFQIPVYAATARRPWKIRAGLSLYALLGGLSRHARFRTVPREEWNSLDDLRTGSLEAVFQYWDAATDDAALTRAVARSAESFGCRVVRPARFLEARGTPEGYRVRYEDTSGLAECLAQTLVNAAGPWIDRVQAAIVSARGKPAPRLPIDLVQGAHIVLAGSIQKGIYYTEAPTDQRAVFVMPWKGNTLVGTTETPFRGDPDQVLPLPEEIAYLQDTFVHYFPGRPVEIIETFAGLRVLPAGPGTPFTRSREVILSVDEEVAPHLIAIYGGKLTGYRRTARKVMTLLAKTLPPPRRDADTAKIPLV